LEDHEPIPNRPVDAGDTKVADEPESLCDFVDDDGDGVVDNGFAWRVGLWHDVWQEKRLDQVKAVRLASGSVLYAFATAGGSGSVLRVGACDSGARPVGAAVELTDGDLDSWAIAADVDGQTALVAYLPAGQHDLHLARVGLKQLIEVESDGIISNLPYHVGALFDLEDTTFGPVALVRDPDLRARAEWLDHLDNVGSWNHVFAGMEPDVARLAAGPWMGWVAGGHTDGDQVLVRAGTMALDGMEEVLPPATVEHGGGGVSHWLCDGGATAAWIGDRLAIACSRLDSTQMKYSALIRGRSAATGEMEALASLATSTTEPLCAHSVTSFHGNVIATHASTSSAWVHRRGPGFEAVRGAEVPVELIDTVEHAIVAGDFAPVVLRIDTSRTRLLSARLECP